jgi:16S rRNA (uracil1498-N3)-methyltransferase
MHRFFVPPEETHGPEIVLPNAEAHHAITVLRLRPGDRVSLLNGVGEEILGQISELSPDAVRVSVVQRHQSPALPCAVTLIQAAPKPRAMELIVQKATELGAARILPVLSERTVPLWDSATASAKLDKWRTTAIEAAKQCGTPWLPHIELPIPLPSRLAQLPTAELTLVASLQSGAHHPGALFRNFATEHQRLPKSVAIWVGPEGDYTPAELNAIQASGALPITLGPLVLRAETAALYCLSVISYETQSRPRNPAPAPPPA